MRVSADNVGNWDLTNTCSVFCPTKTHPALEATVSHIYSFLQQGEGNAVEESSN